MITSMMDDCKIIGNTVEILSDYMIITQGVLQVLLEVYGDREKAINILVACANMGVDKEKVSEYVESVEIERGRVE